MAINYSYNFAEVARDSGFKLSQHKDGALDWRLIGCLEIERILRDQSLEQIEGVLSHLSEVPLGNILDTNILDSGIAKYFVLTQFSIQYLLFCRTFLDETVKEIRESLVESQIEVRRLKKSVDESNNEILQLNKKIIQTEAINEVVYPCHMCTKNFINNEALNLHIGRKHGNRSTDRRIEPSLSSAVQHDRDSDRNLISTIKLELEIKQLKERLNTAEKAIRERSEANSRRLSSDPVEEKFATRDIGVQSNLTEEKERDDSTRYLDADEETRTALDRDRGEEMLNLQKMFADFEQWQDAQKKSSEQSIGEINEKLENIALTLSEAVQRQRVAQRSEEQQQQPLNATISCTMEQLEKMIMERLSEIGKTSAANLEEAVNHMEQKYSGKLNELEEKMRIDLNTKVRAANVVQHAADESGLRTQAEGEAAESVVWTQAKETRCDETYDIVDIKDNTKCKSAVDELRKNLKVSLSSESNRTFVKTEDPSVPKPRILSEADKITKMSENPEADVTDVSESLSEEEAESYENSNAEDERETRHAKKIAELIKGSNQQNKKQSKNKEEQRHHFTRETAKHISNQRLAAIGFDYKINAISRAALFKANEVLRKHRRKRHPDFLATRKKLRKFVENLCSTKLPQNAKALLRRTQPLRPAEIQHHRPSTLESFDSDLDAEEMERISTPVEAESDGATFKHHLECLLNYPKNISEITVAAEQKKAPVPIPRKRVMFNTLSDAVQADASETSEINNCKN